MPEYVTPVDAETIAIGYLTDADELSADVSGRLPPGFRRGDSHLRIVRVGGVARDHGWLDRARLQVDAYASDEIAAFELAAVALRLLLELPAAVDPDVAVVTDVRQDLGLRNAADLEHDGAPRYLFGVVLSVHPPRS